MKHLRVGPNELDNQEFGDILREFREATGMRRLGASEKLDISSEYLRLIERGKRVPALGSMSKMLELYEVPHTYRGERFLIIGETTIEFKSRILESRKRRSIRIEPGKRITRHERMGEIVDRLTRVNNEMLERVYALLTEGNK